ncbi:MAG: right-handed parallel beta-helix repeat-containing protein [Bacteroidales bacterium]|nr:right-handed parallel beta-helix repeat-containing protein [Bacteroidales bacterium]
MMLCPYCLEQRDLLPDTDPDRGRVLRCPHPACGGYTIPLQYAADHDSHPPLPVSIIGLPGHGKTVFIESLIEEINGLAARWKDTDFYYSWLDEIQMRQAMTRLRTIRQGRLPEGTRTIFQQPQILRLDHIPRVGGCQLVIFDTGGEAFLDATVMADAAKYVQNSTNIVMLLSVKEDEEQGGPELINAMMAVYLQTMSQAEGKTKNQNLIVVLTKGDELLARPDLPESARRALTEPDYSPTGPIWDILQTASQDLEKWLRSDHCGYSNFVNLVRSRFQSVRYCLVSAQGQSAQEGGLGYRMMPRGVLAPLFWLWRLDRSPIWTVSPDGTRELFLDLEEAIRQSRGRMIRLEEQTYRLPDPLTISIPVTITGAGKGKTILRCGGPKFGLRVATSMRVHLQGMTVRRDGPHPGDVIRLSHGELILSDCVVTGGRSGDYEGRPYQGHGISQDKASHLGTRAVELLKNHGVGILTRESASLRVEGCLFVDNGLSGIFLTSSGLSQIRQSTFRNNKSGMTVEQATTATIEDNTFEANVEAGVMVRGPANPGITLRANRCLGNGKFGIFVRDQATPQIDGNTCETNREDGIVFVDQTGGLVTGNRLTANGRNGARVSANATPTLKANAAMRNGANGLLYTDSAAGTAQENECSGNQRDGIRVEGTGGVVLESNIAQENDGYGLAVLSKEATAHIVSIPAGKDNRRGAVHDPRPKASRWFRR